MNGDRKIQFYVLSVEPMDFFSFPLGLSLVTR